MKRSNISIAMCTYNGVAFLDQQLKSLTEQTSLPLEVIVCDDGSTDGTLQILKQFAESAPFPVVVRKNEHKLNFTGNFFQAASLCTGDYIAFCDQDDIWETCKLEVVQAHIDLTHADLYVHEGLVIDEHNESNGRIIPNLQALTECPERPPFDQGAKGFAMVVSKVVVGDILCNWDWAEYLKFERRFGAPFGHDLVIYAWCLDRQIVKIYQRLVRYRIHRNNTTATYEENTSFGRRVAARLKAVQFSNFNYTPAARKWRQEARLLVRFKLTTCRGVGLLHRYLSESASIWGLRGRMYRNGIPFRARWRILILMHRRRKEIEFGRTLSFLAIVKDLLLLPLSRSKHPLKP